MAAPGMEEKMKSLKRSMPSAEGIDAGGIYEFLEFVDQHVKMNSVMIVKNGRVVAEGWWGPYAPEKTHALFSASKTYTGLAVGFACQDGLLDVHDKVAAFFPEKARFGLSENMAAMEVEHLLTMTTGLREDPHDFVFRKNDDWVYRFLRLYVPDRPGERFVYSTHASYMLAAIVQRVTGRTAFDYLNEKLFQPLGYSDQTWWETCPRGVNTGGWGLYVTTEDYAKLGVFLLNRGAWEGRQLLNAAWVDRATSKLTDSYPPEINAHESYGYGYQIWRGERNSFRVSGGYGQYCCVYPQENLVVATTAGEFQCNDSILDAVERFLLPACGRCNEDCADMQEQLKESAARLHIEMPIVGEKSVGPAIQYSGVRYLLSPSHLDYRWIRLSFGEEADRVEFGYFDRSFSVPVGHGEWLPGETCVDDSETDTDVSVVYRNVSCAGGWVDKDCYELKMCFDRTPYVARLFPGWNDRGRLPAERVLSRPEHGCNALWRGGIGGPRLRGQTGISYSLRFSEPAFRKAVGLAKRGRGKQTGGKRRRGKVREL